MNMRAMLAASRWLLPVALAFVLTLSCDMAAAHEVRPALLQITEVSPDRFDVLWKQPSAGEWALKLRPSVSNGLLDHEPDEETLSSGFVMRRWMGLTVPHRSFDGATIGIDGLASTLTDVLVSVSFADGQSVQQILRPARPSMQLQLKAGSSAAPIAYLRMGVEHILTGFDHLSFVLGLLLLVSSRLALVRTVTAFTLGHSITLCAAANGWVHVNAPLIEALVALSILFVAVEVVRHQRGQDGLTVQRPWLIALIFGLLHGFAFAGSLAQVGLPPQHIPLALLLFNVGVEIGQLLFIGVVLAGLVLCRYLLPPLPRWTRALAPYAIGTLAACWMYQRLPLLL
jgi:hydrogenase/urease accessory protein HupE